MSESFPESQTQQPKILELVPQAEDPSRIHFVIDRDTRGIDVTATLRYMQPDTTLLRACVDGMLAVSIDKYGVLDDGEIKVQDPIGYVSDQLSFERSIKLGEKPTYAHIKDALTQVYGDEATKYEERLLEQLVEEGHYVGCTVLGTQRNEIVVAEPDQIALEMEALNREFGTDM